MSGTPIDNADPVTEANESTKIALKYLAEDAVNPLMTNVHNIARKALARIEELEELVDGHEEELDALEVEFRDQIENAMSDGFRAGKAGGWI